MIDFDAWIKEGTQNRPTRYTVPPWYDSLPASIKAMYSAEQYAWMSDEDKATLIQDECTPEAVGDF